MTRVIHFEIHAADVPRAVAFYTDVFGWETEDWSEFAGLQPGEVVYFHLKNSGIEPVEYRIVADADGAWRKFYVPFLWHREGGTVAVDLQSASCSLDLAFEWTRRRP